MPPILRGFPCSQAHDLFICDQSDPNDNFSPKNKYDIFDPNLSNGLLNNRGRQLFGFNKTMKQLLNDGDTTYGDTLYEFVAYIYLLKKL